MKMTILILFAAMMIPAYAAEEPERPISGVPYLRTQVVGMSKGKKQVRIMVWAKNIPLEMRAYRFKGDPKPIVSKIEKGDHLDTTVSTRNNYSVEVLWEGRVVMAESYSSKNGL